jgi:hypothetical protein
VASEGVDGDQVQDRLDGFLRCSAKPSELLGCDIRHLHVQLCANLVGVGVGVVEVVKDGKSALPPAASALPAA